MTAMMASTWSVGPGLAPPTSSSAWHPTQRVVVAAPVSGVFRGGAVADERRTRESCGASCDRFTTLAASPEAWRHPALLCSPLLLAAVAARRRAVRRFSTAVAVAAPPIPTRAATEGDRWFSDLQNRAVPEERALDLVLSEKGQAVMEELAAPSRDQEAWKYTDLQALLYGGGRGSQQAPLPQPQPTEALTAAGTFDADVLELKGFLAQATRPTVRRELERLLGRMQSADEVPDDVIELLLEEDAVDAPPCARLVFVNGTLSTSLSRTEARGDNFVGGGLELRARGSDELKVRTKDLLAALPEVDMFPSPAHLKDALGCAKMAVANQSLCKDCACIMMESSDTPDDVEKRVEVVFVTSGWDHADFSAPRLLADVGKNRKLHLVESHISLNDFDQSLSNGVGRVLVGEGSSVRHELLQQKAESARIVESVTSEVAARGEYSLRLVQTGARAARVNVGILLNGTSSSCNLTGVCVAGSKQQLDVHSLIHHIVPGCRSTQKQKNLVGDSAECIFKGAIKVEREAQQTASEQICRTLLLSKKAKVKAMPLLQIKADDVQCSHGAAVTELDPELVFYMKSRGLSGPEANELLLKAFPQDLLTGLSTSMPKAYQRIQDKLARAAASAK